MTVYVYACVCVERNKIFIYYIIYCIFVRLHARARSHHNCAVFIHILLCLILFHYCNVLLCRIQFNFLRRYAWNLASFVNDSIHNLICRHRCSPYTLNSTTPVVSFSSVQHNNLRAILNAIKQKPEKHEISSNHAYVREKKMFWFCCFAALKWADAYFIISLIVIFLLLFFRF